LRLHQRVKKGTKLILNELTAKLDRSLIVART
jgi:hypothetical protein